MTQQGEGGSPPETGRKKRSLDKGQRDSRGSTNPDSGNAAGVESFQDAMPVSTGNSESTNSEVDCLQRKIQELESSIREVDAEISSISTVTLIQEISKTEVEIQDLSTKINSLIPGDPHYDRQLVLYEKLLKTASSNKASYLRRLELAEKRKSRLRKEIIRIQVILKNTLRWEPAKPLSCSLTDESMFFVNREGPVETLSETLSGNFIFGTTGAGMGTAIPFIDDTDGMGKSSFGIRYVDEFKELVREKKVFSLSGEFIESLSRARTVCVTLGYASLIQPDSGELDLMNMENALLREIHSKIQEMINNGEIKGKLANLDSSQKAKDLLRGFILETKTPLFLVLDNVGNAFACEDEGTLSRRNRFLRLCRYVLKNWFQIKHLHFLLMGRGDIFNDILAANTVKFKRITLNLIREEYYTQILAQTTRNFDGREIPLMKYFNISEQNKKRVYDAIKRATNGHPRSMLQMFTSCETIEALESFQPEFPKQKKEALEPWLEWLRPYREEIRELLALIDTGVRVNLEQKFSYYDPESLHKVDLAEKALIRWEGDLNNAQLFVSQSVRDKLQLLWIQ